MLNCVLSGFMMLRRGFEKVDFDFSSLKITDQDITNIIIVFGIQIIFILGLFWIGRKM